MRRTRAVLLGLLATALVALAVGPAAAQPADSATEELIWDLNNQLLYVAIPITVLVEAILIYTVWKYRKNESPLPTKENRRLEITWTIATAIILLFVGVASYQVMAQPYVTAEEQAGGEGAEDALEVQVYAEQFRFVFEYPEQGASSSDRMVIPVDRDVRINVTSRDVIHSFHVPDLGLKQDVMPGESNYILTRPQSTGEYQLYCAEFCGVGHPDMLGVVEVTSQDDFESWIAENSDGGEASGNETAANGTETPTDDDATGTNGNETGAGANETAAGNETAAIAAV